MKGFVKLGLAASVFMTMIVFAMFFVLPAFAVEVTAHTSTADLQPEWSPADADIEFSVEICNQPPGVDPIDEVRIYNNQSYTSFDADEKTGWYKSPYNPVKGYYQYTALDSSNYIDSGECQTFTFSAHSPGPEYCNLQWTFETRDINDVWKFVYDTTSVDDKSPTIEKEIIGPQNLDKTGQPCPNGPELGQECWITQSTTLKVTVTEQGVCGKSGLDWCEITYTIDGAGPVQKVYADLTGALIWVYEFSFGEDSVHVLDIECQDIAGNFVSDSGETFRVDTTPPVTTKTYGTPYFNNGVSEWITTLTPITLTAPDGGAICAIGTEKVWYLDTLVPDSFCESVEPDPAPISCIEPTSISSAIIQPEVGCQPVCPSPYDYDQGVCVEDQQKYCVLGKKYTPGTEEWYKCVEDRVNSECACCVEVEGVIPVWRLLRPGQTIYKPEESCHIIQFVSADYLGNYEQLVSGDEGEIMKYQCMFVEDKPPVAKVYTGDPKVECGDGEGCAYYIRDHVTPITITCEDKLPHPSGVKSIEYRWKLDDGAWTAWLLYTTPIIFEEDSVHTLEYRCIDNLDHKAEGSIVYKVDSQPPVITKTMIGTDHLGDCPPDPEPSDDVCYVRDNGVNGVRIDVADDETYGCVVDDVTCSYELWWMGKVIKEGSFCEDGLDILFTEDSTHTLKIWCEDALGNSVYDEEEFLVDSTPPVTTKTYGEPTVVKGDYRWITSDTPITLDATDAKVGVDGIYYMHEWVSNEICEAHPAVYHSVTTDYLYPHTTGTNVFPSTNELNKNGENVYRPGVIGPHVNLVSTGVGEVTLEFVNPQTYVTCFEYMTDGDTSQVIGSNYHPDVADLYPYECVTDGTVQKTISANEFVEVRSVFGGERDWDFDWTRFDVLPDTTDWEFVEDDTVTFNIPEDSCHVIQYFAVDLLGNQEELQKQFVMVDNKPPQEIKIVGEPNIPIGDVGDCETTVEDLDVLFLFDLTGSMGGVIDSAKTEANEVMTQIKALVPSSQFGAGSFMDTVGTFSSCGYSAQYAGSGDYPWHLDQDITGDTAAVSSAINGLILGWGADGPEGYAYALQKTQSVSWRTGAKKVVVIFQDDRPHDCNLGEYDSCTSTTGADPGADGLTGTGDDVTWAGVAAELEAAGISVISIDSGYSDSCRDAVWGYLAGKTGGASAMLGSDFTQTIVDLVTEVIGDCSDNYWVRDHVTPITLNCIDQSPHPVGGELMCYKISFDDPETPWLTADYCSEFGQGGVYNSDTEECCVDMADLMPKGASVEISIEPAMPVGYTFTFMEDSMHDLEFYCEDELGNTAETDVEYFKVDSIAPETDLTFNGAYFEKDSAKYIDTASWITLTSTDGGPVCAVGVDKIYWQNLVYEMPTITTDVFIDYCQSPAACAEWDPKLANSEGWNEYTGAIYKNEESCHVLAYYAVDALGNEEPVKWECFYVDKQPPVTTKTYEGPQYGDYPKWITSETDVVLSAEDQLPHPSGVFATYYKDVYLPDEEDWHYCYEDCGSWVPSSYEDDGWMLYDEPFNKEPESCHIIEYYSVDNVGKKEAVKWQCVFVDNSAPDPLKTVSDPKTKWDGADANFYDIADKCWSLDPEKFIECWKINLLTPITLDCVDPEPHPVDHNTACFNVNFDGDDITPEYCTEFTGVMTDGYCCVQNAPVTFFFGEESEHNLKYYCVDALGNEGEIDDEKFKVEGTTFDIVLNKKWNLISVPFTMLDNSIGEVFKDQKDIVKYIWTYDAETEEWYVYYPASDSGTLTTMEPGWGYWVKALEGTTLKIGGSLFSPAKTPASKDIVEGWNLIGYWGTEGLDGYYGPVGAGKSAHCELYSLGDDIWDKEFASLWTYWEPDNPEQWKQYSEYSNMDPGAGYWLFTTQSGEYVVPTTCGGIFA